MTRLPIEPEPFDSELPPEFSAIADQLRREADQLAEQYSPTEVDAGLALRMRQNSPVRSGTWRAAIAATVALSMLLAVGWSILPVRDDDSDPELNVLAAGVVERGAAAVENSLEPVFESLETLPVITEPVSGLDDMNGPELEAVLNLLDEDTTHLKLAI